MPQSNVLPDTVLPVLLSGQFGSVLDHGYPYDVLIEGVPFILKPSDEHPLLHQLLSDQKEQFDSSREAGENSFGRWWLRSQSTFHGGQGQKYLDSGDPEPTRTRFESSDYAYPFEPGQLTIAGQVATAVSTKNRCVQVTWSGVQKLVTASTSLNEVRTYTLPGLTGETVITLGASGTPADITTDGVNVFVAIADKIWRINSSGTATNIYTVTFTGTIVLGYAKQRLIFCMGNKVWELDPNPGSPPVALGGAHYINPSTEYVYTCVAEGPDAIYLSGYSGLRSDISSMSVTESAGTIVLGPAITQLLLPPGELAQAIHFYLLTFFAVATTRGVRIGTFTPYKQPQIGPLSIEGVPCYSLTASGSLVWVGGKDSVWWVDLSSPLDQFGTYASAMYTDNVGLSVSDTVLDLVVYVNGTRDLVFGTTSSGNLFSQTSWVPAGAATLTTSWVRFGTTESKRLHYITVEGDFPAVGSVTNVLTVKVESTNGESKTFNIPGGPSTFEFSCSGMQPAQAFRLVFTLRDATTDHGVLLRSWQMKALPTPQRYPEIVLPLMLSDYELPSSGSKLGYAGFARERLEALKDLARNNSQVTVVDRLTGTSYQAEIARIQFHQTLPPTRDNRLSGIVNVVLGLV